MSLLFKGAGFSNDSTQFFYQIAGHLFICTDDKNLKNIETISNILKSTSGKPELDPYSVFEDLSLSIKKLSPSCFLGMGILKDKDIYLYGKGTCEAYLKRSEKIGKILVGDKTVKGVGEEGDRLIMTGSSYFDSETRNLFQEILNESESTDIITRMKSEISHAHGVVVELKIKEEKKIEAPQETSFQTPQDQELTETREDIEPGKRIVFSLPQFSSPKNAILSLFKKGKEMLIEKDEDGEDEGKEISAPKKSKKALLVVSCILIAILSVSIFSSLSQNRSRRREKILSETITVITPRYDEAVSLIDLNPLRARDLLASTKKDLAPLLDQFPKESDEYKKANEWLGKIVSAEVAAYKIYKLTGVPVFFDISLIKSGGEGRKISVFESTSAILDVKNQTLYTLDLKTKQSRVLAGSQDIKDASSVTVYGKNAYLVNNEGIIIVSLSSGKVVNKIDKPPEWGEISDISSYGGNLYLLDTGKNTIWKYIAGETGFNPIQPYLNSDTKQDLFQATSMVIDGSIWVVKPEGLLHFNRGLLDPFTFKGFSDSIPEYGAFSSTDESKSVYVLDKTISRIVVFDKEGTYQSQYQWDELKNATSIYADEQGKKIFVLIGSKIYGMDMK